ncbi:MAG: carboxypeptidase-like regulatory domain-containing protein, partial [Chloroflexota bacterium]|nr:carboxypeptidase-like regulatory domain-containing protein [Chloroflexota bacterium]
GQPAPADATAVTDASGAYTLSFPTWTQAALAGNMATLQLYFELPPGFFVIGVTKDTGESPSYGRDEAMLLVDDLGVGPIDITLGLGEVVEGRVTNGLTAAPLAGVRVSALRLNSIAIYGGFGDAFEQEAQATTDATGRYSLTVRAGTYVIYAQETGGSQQRFWSEDPTVFQATPLSVDRAVAGINIALVPVTTIGGEVRSGPRQFTDAVTGARVVAYLAGDTPCCRIGGVAITGEQGFFLMYVPPGLYRIEFTPPAESPYAAEWWSEAAGFATATDVNVGSEPIQLEVELAPVSP